MRFGIALALLCTVIVLLLVPRAFAQFTHQLGGHDVPLASDHKSLVHAEDHQP